MVNAKMKKMAVKKRPISKAELKEKDPEYMIQLNDPKGLRKDILESLRELIIFMQGDEGFKKIQDEKVELFGKLKSQVREVNSIIENQLKRYLPKGKLKDVPAEKPKKEKEEEEEFHVEEAPKPKPVPVKKEVPVKKSELEELEDQLKDIENQLRSV